MFRYRKYVHVVVFLIIVGLSYQAIPAPDTYLDEQAVVPVAQYNETLYDEISQKSEEYNEEPENAVVDRVWKKTPGRNGLKVNVEKSYSKMKEKGSFDEDLLVFDQLTPEVSLEDLPPSPIYRGHPEKEMISFLINVSWGEEHIPDILNTLKESNIKATFFIEGKWAKNNSELVKMIDEQGHIIGNHAYNHPDMSRLSEEAMIEQISQTNDILQAITDKKPKWFAPPSGSYNDRVVQMAHQLDMETILWTVDTVDWKNPSVSVMLNRVHDKIHPGATILMHPTQAVANGLPELIERIEAEGYKVGHVGQLMSEER